MSRELRVSRRGALGLTGLGAALGAGGASAAFATRARDDDQVVPFHGSHQAGITTPAQDRMFFAAFDVTTDDREELVELLQRWTRAAEQMTSGAEVSLTAAPPEVAPPSDTGEAAGLTAAHLTLTFGLGPTLFGTEDGEDRFGLAARRPAALRRLPHFPQDALDPRRSDGDLCVQACADDPQVAVHAVRNLARLAFGTAAVRWTQMGFGRTASTSTAQQTPRNLFGFKDGTANLKAEDPESLAEHVWVRADDDPAAGWLAGGTYLAVRRIDLSIETWDRTSLLEQQQIFGRHRDTGAPLTGGGEFDELDLAATGQDGLPVIPLDSHVRLAHPSHNRGARMLRRGYNFVDGDDGLGRMRAGLFFLAFVRDPGAQFIPMQTRLSREDRLMEYVQHTGSALFAVPPGVAPGGWVGETLLG